MRSCAGLAQAAVQVASPFTDHMVLQRGQPVPIWGWAAPGETVTVAFGGQEKSAVADIGGRWQVTLDILSASAESRPLTITGSADAATVTLRDVLVGEVWLASGQSNMDFTVAKTEKYYFAGVVNEAAEVAAANHPMIRMFTGEWTRSYEPRDTVDGAWLVCTPETVREFSAIGYFFARDLQHELGVPVGIVTLTYGASCAQAWIRREAIAADPVLKPLLDTFDEQVAAYEPPDAGELAAWQKAVDEAKAAGQRPPRRPKPDPAQDQHNPTVMFNGMIAPFVGYALSGVIWYQGESITAPRELFPRWNETLIRDWRALWGRELPFYFCQLAALDGKGNIPQVRAWQAEALSLPATGMAVTIDVGDKTDVHPHDKAPVGDRLARIALANVYGREIEYSGPVATSLVIEGAAARVQFGHVADGLVGRDGALQTFELAGADGVFHPASAVIDGATVVVTAQDVSAPVTVRYAWSNYPEGCNLYNSAGLPAAPFQLTAAVSPSSPRVTLDQPALPIPSGPFAPTWDSIRANYRTPAWLVDGKFGIFLHWGVYAVPGRGSEWYPRHMYATQGIADWHRERFGPQDRFGYKDFIPLFKAEKFDAAAWVELFRRAGARYVMPVAEHHDGFAMYDSALTRWDAKDMGPRRDLLGELAGATRAAGLVFALSNHRMEHWDFMYPLPDLATDLFDPAFADFYGPPQPPRERALAGEEVFAGHATGQSPAFLEEWLRRNQELVDKYRPQMVFFDNGVNPRRFDDVKLRFAAYYYNRAAEWGLDASVTTKADAYLAGTVKDYERGRPVGISEQFWQCDTSIAHNSWGYIDGLVLRNAGEMIRELVDCVSKNGAYLLNLAPRADGTIPEDQQLRLLQMGEWLGVNGEAIYGSRPWVRFGEGPTEERVHERHPYRGITNAMLVSYTPQDMRFTTRRHADGAYTLYAHLFAWPADGRVTITSLAEGAAGVDGTIDSVVLLGSPQPVKFTRDAAGLRVTLPPWRPSDHASVLKISGLETP